MSASADSLAHQFDLSDPREAMQPGMWVILIEIGVVIGLAAFIVWWTWPKKRGTSGADDERKDGDREP